MDLAFAVKEHNPDQAQQFTKIAQMCYKQTDVVTKVLNWKNKASNVGYITADEWKSIYKCYSVYRWMGYE